LVGRFFDDAWVAVLGLTARNGCCAHTMGDISNAIRQHATTTCRHLLACSEWRLLGEASIV
jgi:hypothetical protein